MEIYDIVDPRFSRYVIGNAMLEKLADGFRWLEGPVWFGDMDTLVFSDVPGNRVMRWSVSGGVQVLREPSGFANGHTRDCQGRLITCSHLERCVQRTEYDGRITTLVADFDGKRLNSPNDVVVKSDGTIWFSDPNYGITGDYQGERAAQELPCCVYRYDPASNSLDIATDVFENPNGLCFSPDERILYVAETGGSSPNVGPHIRAFDVSASGESLGNGVVFYEFEHGNADGFRCDEDGNLWCGAADGVHCVAPSGSLLGRLRLPSAVSNVAFGGIKRNRLFVCASQTLYSIYVNTRGVPFPPGSTT